MEEDVFWHSLGFHVQSRILSFLPFDRAIVLSRVCRQWRSIVYGHRSLWDHRWLRVRDSEAAAADQEEQEQSSSQPSFLQTVTNTVGSVLGLTGGAVVANEEADVSGQPTDNAASGEVDNDQVANDDDNDDDDDDDDEDEDGEDDDMSNPPKRVCHIVAIRGDLLFIHGGHVPKQDTKFIGAVRDDLQCFDLSAGRWVTEEEGWSTVETPTLTEHTGCVWEGRWILFGGFNGLHYSFATWVIDFESKTCEWQPTIPDRPDINEFRNYPYGEETAEQRMELLAAGLDRPKSLSVSTSSVDAAEGGPESPYRRACPFPVSAHTAVVHGDFMYVYGGWNGQQSTRALHRLNLRAWVWEMISLGNVGRSGPSVVPPSIRAHCAVLVDVPSVLNPLYQSYEITAPAALAASQDGDVGGRAVVAEEAAAAAATVASEGHARMWVWGGYAGEVEGHRAGILEYNFEQNSWRELTTAFEGKVGLELGPRGRSRAAAAVFTPKQGALRATLLVLGGWDRRTVFGEFWAMDIQSRRWKRIHTNFDSVGISQHRLCVWNGYLLAVCGYLAGNRRTVTNELWAYRLESQSSNLRNE